MRYTERLRSSKECRQEYQNDALQFNPSGKKEHGVRRSDQSEKSVILFALYHNPGEEKDTTQDGAGYSGNLGGESCCLFLEKILVLVLLPAHL